MKVIYSISARLGGGGIGSVAHHAITGIHRAGWLERLFVSSNAQDVIPASQIRDWGIIGRGLKYLAAKDNSGLIAYLENVLFDAWVAAQLPRGDIFHGWNGMCLRTLREAKRREMVTIVERASSHPTTQFQLLREEYARWKVSLKLPRWNYPRSLSEMDEADYITLPSAFVRESMISEGVNEQKLIEIPFGVDLKRFSVADIPAPHAFRVIFAGQVSIRKGVPYLLVSWQHLKWSDAELWIVGSIAPDFASLRKRWANVVGVRFFPHSPELQRLLQQSDVFVFPSIEEGSALVTYEAMACGLPVITTPNAGSVVRDGEDGFIVPIRDVGLLCDRLKRLRADAVLRAQMSRSARARAEQFSWVQYQDRLIANYRRLGSN